MNRCVCKSGRSLLRDPIRIAPVAWPQRDLLFQQFHYTAEQIRSS